MFSLIWAILWFTSPEEIRHVEAKFPPEAKAKAEKMIANVITAFQNRIQKLDWMTEETKQKATDESRDSSENG